MIAVMSSITQVQCCIAGGGPAGMMLGYLLARAGVRTLVLEKHGDFLRDFRGDTVHPSTLRVMDDLGVLDRFLARPHQRLERIGGWFGAEHIQLGDFRGLPARHAFIALMPQWEFLDFLKEEGGALPALEVRMNAEVTSLVEEGGVVRGVRGRSHVDGDSGDHGHQRHHRDHSDHGAHGAHDDHGDHSKGDNGGLGGLDGDAGREDDAKFEVRADLVVGCDGRRSTVRAAAGLPVEDVGAPIDVLWFRVGREPGEHDDSLARVAPGHFVVTIDRGDYWQCAFVIHKGGADDLRAAGIAAFREEVVAAAPLLASRIVGDVRSWDDVKLLTVSVDRLVRWSRPGLLCIGDAAHAMSPIGGVGINLAVQDAVATANLLAAKLRAGVVGPADLDAVRARRSWPTRATQRAQVAIQDNVLVPALGSGSLAELHVPLPIRLVTAMPMLQRVVARALGMGVRPEHVRSPVA